MENIIVFIFYALLIFSIVIVAGLLERTPLIETIANKFLKED